MKGSFLSFAALVLVASCSKNFVIKGTVDDSLNVTDGTFVTVLDNTGEEVGQIPVENGKFTYSLPVDITKGYYLVLQAIADDPELSRNSRVFVIPDKSKAEVSYSATGASVSGSRLTDAFNSLRSTYDELTAKAGDELQAAYAEGNEALAESVEAKYAEDLKAAFMEPYLQNADNYVGVMALNVLFEYLDYDEAAELVEKGGELVSNDEDIVRSLGAKKAKKDTSVGCKFVEIKGKTANGEDIKLSDFVGKGNYVLVDFWASWCGPCMRAIPNARALLQKYASKGFQLVGVNCWERKEGAGQAKAAEMEMTWPVIFAEDTAPDVYGVEAIPTLILFGHDGTIVERLLGETGLNEAVARHFEE